MGPPLVVPVQSPSSPAGASSIPAGRSASLRASVEEFRTRKEATKAAYLAAQEAAEATWAEVAGDGGPGSAADPASAVPDGPPRRKQRR